MDDETSIDKGKLEMIDYVLNHYCDCELCRKIKSDLNGIKYDIQQKAIKKD